VLHDAVWRSERAFYLMSPPDGRIATASYKITDRAGPRTMLSIVMVPAIAPSS